MHLSSNISTTPSTPSYHHQEGSVYDTTTTTTSDTSTDYIPGAPLLVPPPPLSYYYQPSDAHFLFPPCGAGGPGSGLPPLTPITPSIDPALGFKNGYIVPQTPNPMTVSQFVQVVQVGPTQVLY